MSVHRLVPRHHAERCTLAAHQVADRDRHGGAAAQAAGTEEMSAETEIVSRFTVVEEPVDEFTRNRHDSSIITR
jgi:hypothetical protein